MIPFRASSTTLAETAYGCIACATMAVAALGAQLPMPPESTDRARWAVGLLALGAVAVILGSSAPRGSRWAAIRAHAVATSIVTLIVGIVLAATEWLSRGLSI